MQDTRHAAILDAALALFAEGGLGAVTVRALGARSGASTGSIYHRFGDRGGVLIGVFDGCWGELARRLRGVLEPDPSAEQGVRGLVHAYLGWVEAHPLQARFVYDVTRAAELQPRAQELLALKAPFFETAVAWASRRAADGSLRSLPPWALDPVLMGPAHEFARRWLDGLQVPMSEARPVIAEAVWSSVRPR